MRLAEVVAFAEIFENLARVLVSRKMDDAERAKTQMAYFRALRAFDLDIVKAGADTLIVSAKHFPHPAEWIDAMPRRLNNPARVPTMFETEAQTWRAAEAVFWEREPCGCGLCVQAGMDQQPGRFVPEFDSWDRERKVFDLGRQRTVTAGHWAHGLELAGYYQARADYLAAADTLKGGARKAAYSFTAQTY